VIAFQVSSSVFHAAGYTPADYAGNPKIELIIPLLLGQQHLVRACCPSNNRQQRRE